MARLRNDNAAALIPDRTRELAEIADWYRRALADEPARRWNTGPTLIGPTWKRGADGGWLLPEHTLGWDFLAWCGYWLRDSKARTPWKWTLEQARFWLWFYALDDEGRPLHDNAVLQRLKGWGKDPMAAGGAVASCFAPLTFDHWDPRTGEPVGREEPNAWVQVCAVSQEQTKNTMKLPPGLIPMETRRHYGIQLGKLNMYALGDSRQIEAVTSSPLALEGGRPTFLIRNETQNWNSSNGGHDMDGVLSGNAAKSADGVNAKMLDICNAYRDGEDSVAQRVREAWEGTQGDPDSPDKGLRPKYMDFGLLYDSIEAAPDIPMTEESIPKVIADVRGDSDWLSTRRILKEIINPKNPVSESRRKWFNQCQAPEDAYVTSQEWDANEHPELELGDGEAIALYDDPARDTYPQLFMRRRRLNETRESLELWDAYNIWTWIHADGAWTFADATPHNATDPNGQPVCPAIRFTNQIDLEGRTPGEVEPYIALANRLNKDNYDRMLAQHYNSWRVRTATGLDMTELSDAQREDRKAKLAQEDILAGGPDVKFGTLPETSLDNLVNARQADVEELAAVSQTPTTAFGKMVNVGDAGIEESRAGFYAKRNERRKSFGVGHLDALRLAAGIEGRTEDAANFDLTPLWEDTDTRTVSQAVDALGKASKMLGVPQEELWDMIPGVTKTRADSWRAWKENHPDADALAVQAYASQLAPATTGGDDGLDR